MTAYQPRWSGEKVAAGHQRAHELGRKIRQIAAGSAGRLAGSRSRAPARNASASRPTATAVAATVSEVGRGVLAASSRAMAAGNAGSGCCDERRRRARCSRRAVRPATVRTVPRVIADQRAPGVPNRRGVLAQEGGDSLTIHILARQGSLVHVTLLRFQLTGRQTDGGRARIPSITAERFPTVRPQLLHYGRRRGREPSFRWAVPRCTIGQARAANIPWGGCACRAPTRRSARRHSAWAAVADDGLRRVPG